MTITENHKSTTDSKAGDSSSAVPDEVIDAVMAGVDAGGLELLGPDGVLADLTKRLIERGLSEELADHLGYEVGDPAGRGSGNNRNGGTGTWGWKHALNAFEIHFPGRLGLT